VAGGNATDFRYFRPPPRRGNGLKMRDAATLLKSDQASDANVTYVTTVRDWRHCTGELNKQMMRCKG
jgi:hypothetical protein